MLKIDWTTKNITIAVLVGTIFFFCLLQFFTLSEAFAYLDNEEMYLKSRLGGSLGDYTYDNLPYVISGLANFWFSDVLFESNSLLKFRFLSMGLGLAALIAVFFLSLEFGAKLIPTLVLVLFVAFSFQIQNYAHWGITGYIAAILYSVVALGYFYGQLDDKEGSEIKRWISCFVLAVAFIIAHPDLIIMLFACSAVVTVSWFSKAYQKMPILKAARHVLRISLPFWLFPLCLLLFLAYIPNSTRDVGVRAHQIDLFFRTSPDYSGFIGFFSFYWDSWYDFFRRALLTQALSAKSAAVLLKFSLFVFFLGGVLAVFVKSLKIRKALLFLYIYILGVVATLTVLNLLNLHQVGRPRYGLYLIVPIFICVVFSASAIIDLFVRFISARVPNVEKLAKFPAVQVVSGRLDIIGLMMLVWVGFGLFTTSMNKRFAALEENQITHQLLASKADIVAVDGRFMNIYNLQYGDSAGQIEHVGSATPKRVKIVPSAELKAQIDNDISTFLAVTAFVPITTVGNDVDWGYAGYEFLDEGFCKTASSKNGRLLVERWDRCTK